MEHLYIVKLEKKRRIKKKSICDHLLFSAQLLRLLTSPGTASFLHREKKQVGIVKSSTLPHHPQHWERTMFEKPPEAYFSFITISNSSD